MDEGKEQPSAPVPVPQPRSRAAIKTPIPLPRTKVTTSCNASSEDEIDSPQVHSPAKSPSSEDGCGGGVSPRSNAFFQHTTSLRRVAKSGLRRVKSNVHETTKNVSHRLENSVRNSVRNILSKRLTTTGVPGELKFDEDLEEELKRTQSLPACDVFLSIKFGSPIPSEVDCDECDGTVSKPPPSYPPPPLPDESIYDEIASVKSSACSVSSRPGDDRGSNSSSSSETTGQQPGRIRLDSCDSFNFYDVVFGTNRTKVLGPCYENVAVEDSYVENVYSEEPARPNKQPMLIPEPVKPPSSESSESKTSGGSIEVYENWKPPLASCSGPAPTARSIATRSVIYEFDPLFEEREKLRRLKKLQESAKDEEETTEEIDFYNIPAPPERVDSLPEIEPLNPPNDEEYFLYHRVAGNFTFSPTDDDPSEATQEKPKTFFQQLPSSQLSSLVRWTAMKRAIQKVAESSTLSRKNSKAKDSLQTSVSIYKPPVASQVPHSGLLLRSISSGDKHKDFSQKWCQISEGKLVLSADKNSSNKETILLEMILSLQSVPHVKSSNGDNIFCWEMSINGRGRPILFGTNSSADTRMWMRKILESLTNVFPSKLTADYSKAGQCFIKEGISGEWTGAWLLMVKRVLYYCQMKEKPKEIDLRKVRLIALHSDDGNCSLSSEAGPYVQIHALDRVLYLQMDMIRETKTWSQSIKMASMECGPDLCDQQLTKDNVPVIVDKCINFIYAHGSMSEGIYRRSGSNSNVIKLMSLFRADAWSVQLSRQDFTEFDVSTVLKRFFRELPDRLLTASLTKYFCNASHAKCTVAERVEMYRSLLEKLPPINYVTARRLFGHLHFVSQQSEKNKMTVENLSAMWAPNLMTEEDKKGLEWSKKKCDAIIHLITHYKAVFLVDGEEMDREKRILEVLEKVHTSPTNVIASKQPSGDFKISVFIGSVRGESVTVVVSPSMEAFEICSSLANKTEYGAHELCLHEMVLNGALSRPLHHTEKVLDVALRWVYWDSADCKDNYFLLSPNTVYREIMPLAKPPITMCGELKFADPKSKSFKSYVFEFSQAKLSYYKDKSCSVKLAEWNIEDIVWYIGHEHKRNPQTRWAITFIRKNEPVKRTKESPFFGWTLAGISREDQLRWMAAMLLGCYPHSELLPKPALI